MSFETIPKPEGEKIGNFEEALAFLLQSGGSGAGEPAFQEFVAGEEAKVRTPMQTLELAFSMAELYYHSGFKAYALECFRELEETGDYVEEETDLFDRVKESIRIIGADLNNG